MLCVSVLGSGVFVEMSRGAELAQSQKLRIKSLKDAVENQAVHHRMLRLLQCKQKICQVYEREGKVAGPPLSSSDLVEETKKTVESFLEL